VVLLAIVSGRVLELTTSPNERSITELTIFVFEIQRKMEVVETVTLGT